MGGNKMRMKQRLIALFAAVSLVAVWDVASSGLDAFQGAFHVNITRADRTPGSVPSREPDYELHRALESLSGVRGITVEGTSGRLEVTRSTTGDVTAEYAVRVWWSGDRSQALVEQARSAAEQVAVAWQKEGDRARLVLERPRNLPADVRLLVDVRLGVPDGVELTADHTGNAFIEGVSGPVRLEHRGGNVVVQDIEGPVTVASSFSMPMIRRVRGPVVVEVAGGNLVLEEIEGPVEGRLQFGDLDLSGVTGDVTFSIDQGTGRIERVGGDLDLKGGYGEVDVVRVAGNVKADYAAGVLLVDGLTRAADLSMRFGEMQVLLEGEGGWNVDVLSTMAEIETDLELDREEMDLGAKLSGVIGDGAHELKINVEQGKVRLTRR